MGLTRQQVIDDVLERYEAHLAFLTFSMARNTASMLTPDMLHPGHHGADPKDAGSSEAPEKNE